MLKPTDIRAAWDQIRDQLARVLDGDDERPEEVYAACRYGNAVLYTCPEGFVVLRQFTMECGGRETLIWVGAGQSRDGKSLLERRLDEIADIARSAGSSTLSLRTRRAGFEKVLPAPWVIRHVEFARSLDNV